MNESLDDPFDSIKRTHSDETGTRVWNKGQANEGLVIFHTVAGDKILAVNMAGKVISTFDQVPSDYRIYRPGKAGNDNDIYCILKDEDEYRKRYIACLDDNGTIIWKTQAHHFTHDFHYRQDSERIVSVLREDRTHANVNISNNIICDMNMDGSIEWSWSVLDNLDQLSISNKIETIIKRYEFDNPFHINSVQIVDYPVATEIFDETVFLVSSRNMNSVFAIGRDSNRIKFEYSGHTIGQHHARILPKSYTNNGNLIIVDNGYNFLPPNRGLSRGFSRVIEVDIETKKIVWEYRSDESQPLFFSPIVGSQQRLENGNTVITEGYYGRIFEINRSGEIVWDYVHPEARDLETHLSQKGLDESGLRQIYRAYKVPYSWMS
jgi:hypothetical protein